VLGEQPVADQDAAVLFFFAHGGMDSA
jgi:hypothetical protein